MKSRLCISFWSDLEQYDDQELARFICSGYIFVPLDSAALLRLKKSKLQFSFIDRWIREKSLIEIEKLAKHWESTWFVPAKHLFTIDSVCWPEFDRHSMHWFWREVAFSAHIASEFESDGILELILFSGNQRKISEYYYSSDLFYCALNYFCSSKGIKCHVASSLFLNKYNLSESKSKSKMAIQTLLGFKAFVTRVIKKVLKSQSISPARINCIKEKIDQEGDFSGLVVVVVNPGEVYRFSDQIKPLTQLNELNLKWFLNTGDRVSVEKISREYYGSFYPKPQIQRTDNSLATQFLSAIELLKEENNDSCRGIFSSFEEHFKYFCQIRWPQLVVEYRSWKDLLEKLSPNLVIVLALYMIVNLKFLPKQHHV